MKKHVSRRELLNLIGLAGGTAAVMAASSALGLVPGTSLSVPDIPPLAPGQRKTVVVLGAGISGLTAAYELTRAGYNCLVLEASHRAGGRNLTVRHGDLIDEVGNQQICDFDDESHLYFNCGPARIPSTHRNLLHYCRELGVELEVFINENKETWIQDDGMYGGRPIKNGVFTTNARGFMAEIMAKSFNSSELQMPFSEWEAERLMSLVRSFGDLSEDDIYKGSLRAGYADGGFLEHGIQKDILSLTEILKSRYLASSLAANEGETGPILFQPVGGMDMIIKAFERALPGKILYNAIVTSVNVNNDGVDVAYENNGLPQTISADYCFNCIPTHLMAGIAHNFPRDYTEAMLHVKRGEAYKSAFQAKQRFWEIEDIYGGISWTNQPIQQIWYPPHGMFKQKGVILAAYDYGGGMHFTRLSQEQRLESAIRQGEKVHPGYREQVEKGITIAWHRMNHMLGCSARWSSGYGGMSSHTESLYNRLRRPVNGRHFFIGDQISMHAGWQESAILSSHWAINYMLNGEPEHADHSLSSSAT